MIDLTNPSLKRKLQETMRRYFAEITSLPKDIREDDKERTGIWCLIEVPNTRNLVTFRIKNPSIFAMRFMCEKSSRMEFTSTSSSQNTENPGKCRWAGALKLRLADGNGTVISASISGLKAQEDAVGCILLLRDVSGLSIPQVVREIRKEGGQLPKEISEISYLEDILYNKS